MGQPFEGGDKQARDKQHQETKCHLRRDQRAHQSPPGVRIFPAFQRAGRFDGRGAEGRREAK